MSIRSKVLGLVDVIMRVPPLFIIDGILKMSMGLPNSTQDFDAASTLNTQNNDNFNLSSNLNSIDNDNLNLTAIDIDNDLDFLKVFSLLTLKFLLCLFGKYRDLFTFV